MLLNLKTTEVLHCLLVSEYTLSVRFLHSPLRAGPLLSSHTGLIAKITKGFQDISTSFLSCNLSGIGS